MDFFVVEFDENSVSLEEEVKFEEVILGIIVSIVVVIVVFFVVVGISGVLGVVFKV